MSVAPKATSTLATTTPLVWAEVVISIEGMNPSASPYSVAVSVSNFPLLAVYVLSQDPFWPSSLVVFALFLHELVLLLVL